MLKIPCIKIDRIVAQIDLPSSKSISHRYLIMQALAFEPIEIANISKSNDTLVLQKGLVSAEEVIDFEDAGTPMRFFLAYAALRNLKVTITGSEGLKRRPISPLVNALSQLGCRIVYLENEGSLPLKIEEGVNKSKTEVIIEGELSSQFVSALLLIAPYFDNGLTVLQNGKKNSESYIDLTIACMQEGMVKVEKTENAYRIFKGEYYTNKLLLVEADWSAAAFVFAWSAAIDCSLGMRYLDLKSKQGDKAIADFFSNMGLIVNSTKFGEVQGVSFKSTLSNTPQDLKFDFTNTPDLFPIIAAVCAYLKIKSKFTGVKNLVLKESNRIKAMQENLLQTGAEINIVQDDELHLNFNNQVKENYFFKTYNDHRIAMACSIFAFQKDIIIEDETVVQKSFPTYWKMFRDLGFISN